MSTKLLFLPGASGNTAFWRPVADLLTHPGERIHFGWPGFAATSPDPAVAGFEDLVGRVTAEIDRPTALIAQSMGGVIALRAALEKPEWVTHLVLTATSGGIDLSDLEVQDWRPTLHAAHPSLPLWFANDKQDLTAELGNIKASALLLWGDMDPISPVAVGERLASLLPRAELHVLSGGNHDLANALAQLAAPLIDQYLAS
ncbi:MAG TPA: alpha/beta fold hydrolase [Gammaproteobacteria bacterium]|nr:alpha/beta fold hydrolase [Gammaproteobacteria bacterium]